MAQDILEAHAYWCPFGRISLQQVELGRTDIVSGGAFNLAVVSQAGANDVTYPSARCLGEVCPFFIPLEKRSKNDSICRMAKDPSKRVVLAASIVALAVIVSGFIIATAPLWVKF